MRWTVLLLTILIPTLALGDIYKWVDESGGVHFSDSPKGSQSETVELPAAAVTGTPDGTNLSNRQAADRLQRARLAREARHQIESDRAQAPSRDCVKARNTLALKQAQWERKSRRGYRQSDKIRFENLIADWQLRVQQRC